MSTTYEPIFCFGVPLAATSADRDLGDDVPGVCLYRNDDDGKHYLTLPEATVKGGRVTRALLDAEARHLALLTERLTKKRVTFNEAAAGWYVILFTY